MKSISNVGELKTPVKHTISSINKSKPKDAGDNDICVRNSNLNGNKNKKFLK